MRGIGIRGMKFMAFHLQQAAPGSAKTVKEIHSIGHAVSKDLIRWEERPLALSPGEPGALDDMEIFTGCTYEKDGLYYLFYTMKSSREQGCGTTDRRRHQHRSGALEKISGKPGADTGSEMVSHRLQPRPYTVWWIAATFALSRIRTEKAITDSMPPEYQPRKCRRAP